MPESPNIKLFTLAPGDTETNVMDWVLRMGSTEASSNMMLLDAAIYALRNGKANKIVESATQPEDMEVGDEWDQII